MKWHLATFIGLLVLVLTLWLGPSIFGGNVLMPLDIMASTPPFADANIAPPPVHNHILADMLYENLVWKKLQHEALSQGEFPLWNPYNFCGHPLYATGQNSTFYPFNLILIAIPLPYGYVVFTWLHLFAGGLFTYLFFRRIGVSGFGATVGGIMFALCTFFTVKLFWPMLLGSAIWLPLMLLWIDWMATLSTASSKSDISGTSPASPNRWTRGLLIGTLLFAMPILSGFLEIAFYVFVACGLYTFMMGIRLWRQSRQAQARPRLRSHPTLALFVRVGSVTAMAAILSLPQLLPFFEVTKRNTRVGEMTYEQAHNLALTRADALTFIIPDALGNPARHEQFDITRREWQPIQSKKEQKSFYYLETPNGPPNYAEAMNYTGFVPLVLICLSVFAPGQRRGYFWILAALGLSMAFVTPIYRVFFALVPGSDQVRSPWRWTMLTAFAFTYLAAIGADWWQAQLTAPVRRWVRIYATLKLAGAVALAIVVVSLLWHPSPLVNWAERLITSPESIFATHFANPADLASMLWNNAARFAIFALAAVLPLSLAFWRTWGRKGATVLSAAVVIILAFDLGQATYHFNTHSDPAILKQQPAVLEYLQKQEAEEGVFRVGRYGWQEFIYPNLFALSDLPEFGGYDSIILTDFARYMEGLDPATMKLLHFNKITSVEQPSPPSLPDPLDSPLYPLLNVRYLLAYKASDKPADYQPLRHPDYERIDVPGNKSNLLLYRVKDDKFLPRAFFVNRLTPVETLEQAIEELKSGRVNVRHHAVVQVDASELPKLIDPKVASLGTARIVDYRTNSVRIETNTTSRQFLVLCDMNYPGWQVTMDNVSAPLISTNGIFRGVSVPEGQHIVEFRFSPVRLRVGTVLSLVTMIGLILASGIERLIEKRQRP